MSDQPYSADNIAEFRAMVETGVNPQLDGSVILLEPEYREWCRRWLLTLAEREAEVERLTKLIDTPEVEDFLRGVKIEAAHQRKRWGEGHDLGKNELEWAGLVSYLIGKAVKAEWEGDRAKAQHHRITTAAALANWHRIVEERHRASGGGEGGGAPSGETAEPGVAPLRASGDPAGTTADSSAVPPRPDVHEPQCLYGKWNPHRVNGCTCTGHP